MSKSTNTRLDELAREVERLRKREAQSASASAQGTDHGLVLDPDLAPGVLAHRFSVEGVCDYIPPRSLAFGWRRHTGMLVVADPSVKESNRGLAMMVGWALDYRSRRWLWLTLLLVLVGAYAFLMMPPDTAGIITLAAWPMALVVLGRWSKRKTSNPHVRVVQCVNDPDLPAVPGRPVHAHPLDVATAWLTLSAWGEPEGDDLGVITQQVGRGRRASVVKVPVSGPVMSVQLLSAALQIRALALVDSDEALALHQDLFNLIDQVEG